jgi:hypothetical protein
MVVHEAARPETRDAQTLRIGHPAGVIETETEVVPEGNGLAVRRATLGRTARRIMDGHIYVPQSYLQGKDHTLILCSLIYNVLKIWMVRSPIQS